MWSPSRCACVNRACAPVLMPGSSVDLFDCGRAVRTCQSTPDGCSLAQAFVKLRGDGLAYDVSRVEFRFTEASGGSSAAMYMDGKRLSQ